MRYLEKLSHRNNVQTYPYKGLIFEIYPNVFPPAADSRVLIPYIQPRPGEETLDMGCGSGINGIIAALRSGSTEGVSVDINPDAVLNTKENAVKHGVQIDVRESDMFANVPVGQYPLIVANGPHHEGAITSPLAYGCFGARKFNERLLGGVGEFMDGRSALIVVFDRRNGLDDYFDDLIKQNNLTGEVIDSSYRRKTGSTYLLYRITK